MITNIFDKTRPLNYLILGIMLFSSFITYFIYNNLFANEWTSVGYAIAYFFILVSSLALVNFITLKNLLTKNDNYAALLFIVFLLFFPKTFQNGAVLISNFFILLALRRLISLRSMKQTKEKIFDASLWIFVAALFHFWSILFLLLVFISIILHVSRDYKNWLIPFIAFFTVLTIFVAVNLYFEKAPLNYFLDKVDYSFNFTYFESVYQNVALAIFSSLILLFFVNIVLTINAKPLNLQSSYKKVVFAFIIGLTIYIFTSDKDNSYLLYSLMPTAVMGANFIEGIKGKIVKEIVIVTLIVFGLFFFFMTL